MAAKAAAQAENETETEQVDDDKKETESESDSQDDEISEDEASGETVIPEESQPNECEDETECTLDLGELAQQAQNAVEADNVAKQCDEKGECLRTLDDPPQ